MKTSFIIYCFLILHGWKNFVQKRNFVQRKGSFVISQRILVWFFRITKNTISLSRPFVAYKFEVKIDLPFEKNKHVRLSKRWELSRLPKRSFSDNFSVPVWKICQNVSKSCFQRWYRPSLGLWASIWQDKSPWFYKKLQGKYLMHYMCNNFAVHSICHKK